MNRQTLLGALVAGVIACCIGLVYFNQATMPGWFPGSSILLPALLTGALAIAIGLMLPDKLFYTDSERLENELRDPTGLGGYDPQRVLSRADEARQHANTLRNSASEMQPDIAQATNAAADDLDALAARILKTPQHANSSIAVIIRAGLVVDAVTNFIDFKADTGAVPEDIAAARERVIDTLVNMSEAAGDVQGQLARVKLLDIDVATEVADGLFKKGEKQ